MQFIYLFSVLIVAIIAQVTYASPAWWGLSDPDAEDMKFYDFNHEDLQYTSGDPIQFKLKIERARHREEFLHESVKVKFLRKRFLRKDIKLELINQTITADPENEKVFLVSGNVPDVTKKGRFAIRVSRSRSLLFWGRKTIAKSDHSWWAIWKTGKRKITISPRA